jgi:HK97 family phage prohead protease
MISTGSYDRDNDRVIPGGGKFANYLKNPVVQYGHNYREPWATVGRTIKLEITKDGIIADFELRPAASESDPQNIVLLLWNGDWVRTASIGFAPMKREDNERDGIDFAEWELLEWSIVPIPSNQEALRQAVKAMQEAPIKNVTDELRQELRQAVAAMRAATPETPAERDPAKALPNSNAESSAGLGYDSPPTTHSAPENASKAPSDRENRAEAGDLALETLENREAAMLKNTMKTTDIPEKEPKTPKTDENEEKPPGAPETAASEELDAPKPDEALLDAIEVWLDEIESVLNMGE